MFPTVPNIAESDNGVNLVILVSGGNGPRVSVVAFLSAQMTIPLLVGSAIMTLAFEMPLTTKHVVSIGVSAKVHSRSILSSRNSPSRQNLTHRLDTV